MSALKPEVNEAKKDMDPWPYLNEKYEANLRKAMADLSWPTIVFLGEEPAE